MTTPSQRFYAPFNMDGTPLLQSRHRRRPLLCPRQHVYVAGAASLGRGGAAALHSQVEDRLHASPDVLLRHATWAQRLRFAPRSSRSSRGHGVDVVFAGHEHFYERMRPQGGIVYIIQGGSAKLRKGNIRRNSDDHRTRIRHRPFLHRSVKSSAIRCIWKPSRVPARSSTRPSSRDVR